jgi:peptidyl-prolyl cis-trans isomerase SurA
LAASNSQELSSATKGGDIGWVNSAVVVPEFDQQMLALKVGELSLPFKTELGWHLMQVLARRTSYNSSDTLRQQATEVLSRRKIEEAVGPWLKRLSDEAEINIYLNESAQ